MTSGKSGSSHNEKKGLPVQRLTLRARLFLFSILMIVPFFALALYLLFNLNAIAGYYSTIVSNITKVNAYNLVFKDDMDSVMYMMVAHSMSKYEVGPELGITNPDEMIREAEGRAEAIRKTQQANADGIRMIKEAGADQAVLALKSLEVWPSVANGKATKIIIPSELQNVAGLIKSVAEVAKDSDIAQADPVLAGNGQQEEEDEVF